MIAPTTSLPKMLWPLLATDRAGDIRMRSGAAIAGDDAVGQRDPGRNSAATSSPIELLPLTVLLVSATVCAATPVPELPLTVLPVSCHVLT